jgi:tRNA threonylcarbamoyladenosine biosynthesis protein TsaE
VRGTMTNMTAVYKKNDLQSLSKEVLDRLKTEGKNVILMEGDLGAGKTTFVQVLAKELGVTEEIISPTFVIQKSYETKDHIFKKLIHIDAYRIEDAREMIKLGWQDTVSNKENLVVVEWPSKILEILPENAKEMKFAHIDVETREISYE